MSKSFFRPEENSKLHRCKTDTHLHHLVNDYSYCINFTVHQQVHFRKKCEIQKVYNESKKIIILIMFTVDKKHGATKDH